MNFKIHKSISEINEADWDAIVSKDRIFCTHKYVESLEKSRFSEGKCFYPAVYDGDKIVAHTTAYFLSTELEILANDAIKKMVSSVRRGWKDFFILRSIECGPPIALGNPLSFKDGIDHAAALKILCRGIEGLAKELKAGLVLFRDFYDSDAGISDPLKRLGYGKIHNLPKAEIKVKWKSFDEYLNSMRSSYRCKIVKSIEKCAKSGITIEKLKNFSEYSRELKQLHDNVSRQAKEIKREPVSEEFFKYLDKSLGDRAEMLVAKKDNKLVGFMLVLFNDKELISSMIGLDYECSRECYIYFNLFYKTIELAIEKGMETIDMGITALNPKKDMGSRMLNLNMYMKHFNPIANKVLPIVFDMVTPPDTEGPRNVFKDDGADQSKASSCGA